MSYRQWVNEMSIAKYGDWSEGAGYIGEFRATKLDRYVLLEDIGEFQFYQLRNSLDFIVGKKTIETVKTKIGDEMLENFLVVLNIQFVREKLLDKIGYSKMIRVKGVTTHIDYQRSGIAKFVYKHIVNTLGYTIMSDKEMYFGARKLWSRLSKDIDVQVDLVDIKNNIIIDKNVILHHGNYDADFDKRIWSYQNDKQYIRSILTRIQ